MMKLITFICEPSIILSSFFVAKQEQDIRHTSHLTLSSSLLDRSEVEGGVDPTGDQDGEDDHLLEVLWDHSHSNTSKRHGDGVQEPDRHVVAEGDHVPHSPVRSDDRDVPDNSSLPPSSHLLLSQTERLLVVPELVDLDIAVRDEWDEGVTEKSHPQSRISLWIIKDISSTSLTHMVIVSTLSSRLLKMFSFR